MYSYRLDNHIRITIVKEASCFLIIPIPLKIFFIKFVLEPFAFQFCLGPPNTSTVCFRQLNVVDK